MGYVPSVTLNGRSSGAAAHSEHPQGSINSAPTLAACRLTVSSVRISSRGHQVTHSAGLRHAGWVGHQPSRAYARMIHFPIWGRLARRQPARWRT
jgi:hypothetical protein